MEPPLDALLREYVTPGMRAAKWKKTRGTYTWQAGNGDRAIITFRRSRYARSDVSTFSVEAGLLPLPAAQMHEYYSPLPKAPAAWHGTYSGRVRPGYAGLDDLGGLWELSHLQVATLGPVLRALVTEQVAPALVQALRRDVLLAYNDGRGPLPACVQWEGSGRGRLCLIADTGQFDQIDAEVSRLRAVDPRHLFSWWSGTVHWLIAGLRYVNERYPGRYGGLSSQVAQLEAEFARQYEDLHGYGLQDRR